MDPRGSYVGKTVDFEGRILGAGADSVPSVDPIARREPHVLSARLPLLFGHWRDDCRKAFFGGSVCCSNTAGSAMMTMGGRVWP
jgi:hypothetical protein